MGTLIEALERIMNWLTEHQPKYAASFLPGLKYDEIQTMEAEFGFQLPEEIYELYQWRNGTQEDGVRVAVEQECTVRANSCDNDKTFTLSRNVIPLFEQVTEIFSCDKSHYCRNLLGIRDIATI